MDHTGRVDSAQRLVSDFCKGYLTRRGFLTKAGGIQALGPAGTVFRPIGMV